MKMPLYHKRACLIIILACAVGIRIAKKTKEVCACVCVCVYVSEVWKFFRFESVHFLKKKTIVVTFNGNTRQTKLLIKSS